MAKKKIRQTRCGGEQLRAVGDSRRVEGYAIVFDTWSDNLGFREIIRPESLDEDILKASDIFALLNHDKSRGILARSKKMSEDASLELHIDEKGLFYAFDAPNTPLGDELLENIRRGEIDSSSFCFTVKEEKWSKDEAGNYSHEILRFDKLYDVSPVYTAAYEATSVDLRGRDELDEELAEAERREAEELERLQAIKESQDRLDALYRRY